MSGETADGISPATRASEAREGVLDVLPLLVAVFPMGLLWGTLAAAKGISLLQSALMSVMVFAGASQLVALELWQSPLPVLLLVFTAFIVNVRHVLMSASLSRHIPSISRRHHPLVAYFLVDESWALAEKRALDRPVSLAYFLGLSVPLWCSWQSSTLLGAWLGKSIGDPAVYGIDFAFSALFISVLMGFWKGSRTGLVLFAAGLAAALAKLWLPGAWYIVIGATAGAAAAALAHSERAEP